MQERKTESQREKEKENVCVCVCERDSTITPHFPFKVITSPPPLNSNKPIWATLNSSQQYIKSSLLSSAFVNTRRLIVRNFEIIFPKLLFAYSNGSKVSSRYNYHSLERKIRNNNLGLSQSLKWHSWLTIIRNYVKDHFKF